VVNSIQNEAIGAQSVVETLDRMRQEIEEIDVFLNSGPGDELVIHECLEQVLQVADAYLQFCDSGYILASSMRDSADFALRTYRKGL